MRNSTFPWALSVTCNLTAKCLQKLNWGNGGGAELKLELWQTSMRPYLCMPWIVHIKKGRGDFALLLHICLNFSQEIKSADSPYFHRFPFEVG